MLQPDHLRDAGVYTHGDDAREMKMMVDYGMKPLAVLRAATSVNADIFLWAGSKRFTCRLHCRGR